jgi:hypothetical protein
MSLAKFVQSVKTDIPSSSREELISKYRGEYMEIFGNIQQDDEFFVLTIDAILNNNKVLTKSNDIVRLWADTYTYRENGKLVNVSIPHLPQTWLGVRSNPKSEVLKLMRETLGDYMT